MLFAAPLGMVYLGTVLLRIAPFDQVRAAAASRRR
jgi:hypothetical protein